LARAHAPVQQSPSRAHMSPVCMQNDELSAQTLFWQRPEQQVVPDEHGLPAVEQVVLSGWQRLLVQVWLQHSLELVHA
jgi:hypothetical protein